MNKKKRKYIIILLKYRFRYFYKFFKKIFKLIVFVFLLYFFVSYFFLKNFKYQTEIDSYKNYFYSLFNNVNNNICNKLYINGMLYSNYLDIQNKVNKYCENENFTLQDLKDDLLKDVWIKNVSIKKKFPDILKIQIKEYYPFAILINKKNEINLIDEYGDVIKINENEIKNFNNLLIIIGEPEKKEIYNLFNLLSIYTKITTNISKIILVNNRRWDIILKNGIKIQFPENNENMLNIWQNVEKLLDINGVEINLKNIDLRIENKIYLKYNNEISTEIKNFK